VAFVLLAGLFARPLSADDRTTLSPFVALYRDKVSAAMKQHSRNRKPADVIGIAYAAWLVGMQTGEPRFRELAIEEYDALLTNEASRADLDFHVSRPFGLLTLRLAESGMLTGDRRAKARDRSSAFVAWFLKHRANEDKHFDCNIALADTLAADCLARAFAADPEFPVAEVRRLVDRLGDHIFLTEDLNENASNYSSLGICFFLELAAVEGWLDRVARSEHFRNMFVRMRDIVSPAGSIPEYGDGYFRAREERLDFVLLLETAARLYDDASFQAVARRLVPTSADSISMDSLPRAFALLDLKPFTPSKTTSAPLSHVQYRRVPGAPVTTVPDKLVLRTGTNASSAMIMIDLYAEGSHAHRYKRPSIGFYEAGGVPLFHNIGRRGTQSGQCGNSFWAYADPKLFPGHPRAGAWSTMTIPATYLAADEHPGRRVVADGIDFRTFHTPGLEAAWFDNLRLEGPRGTLLLDGFESPASWHRNIAAKKGVRLRTSADRTEGAGSQEVNLGIFGEQICTRLLENMEQRGMTFSTADYDTVRFDYKFAGRPPHANLRRLFADWIDLGDHPLHCIVAAARTEQQGGDAFADIEFTDYITPGNGLRRRIALAEEGGLVIIDTFTPGRRVQGWAAGQLWQLYAIADRGPDWFVSSSDGAYAQVGGSATERCMLVKFMTGDSVGIHEEQVTPCAMHAPRADGTKRTSFHTVGSHQIVAGRPITAVMAVLPLRPEDDAAAAAAGVRFADAGDGTVRVWLPAQSATALVEATPAGITIRRER